jgi:hypothetical protein
MRKATSPPATIGDRAFRIEAIPPFDTIRGTCDRWGFGVSTCYDRIGQGFFQAKKFGKRVLVDQESVLRHIESLPPAPIRMTARRRRQLAAQKEAP